VSGGDTAVVTIALALFALLAIGGWGATAVRAVRRRRPAIPPVRETGVELEFTPDSEADILLRGLDLDAELRNLLAERPERLVSGGSEDVADVEANLPA
jgi:hypothetical protein